jgi:hypothetical protein
MDVLPFNILNDITNYLKEECLYSLMIACKFSRNFVCASNVWGKIDNPMDFNNILGPVDGREVFKLFLSIKLSTKNFILRDHYGSCYCLYIVKKWISRSFNDYWNVYSLINYPSDVCKLYFLSGLVLEHEHMQRYYNWTILLPRIFKELLQINDTDRNKILRMLYINTRDYNDGNDYCKMVIMNTKLTHETGTSFDWYPIGYSSKIDPKHFYYNIEFYYHKENFNYRCAIGMNKKAGVYIIPGDFSKKILDISAKLNVNFNTLRKIIIVFLGKSYFDRQDSVNKFIMAEHLPNEFESDDENWD